MGKQSDVSKKRDPKWAMLTADAFLKNSRLFTDSLPKDVNQSANAAVRNLGGLFASGTNLALAVELYLKSLMILLRMDIPDTHELWVIFKRLPLELRDEIEKEFDSTFHSLPEQTVSLRLYIWVGEEPENPPPDIPSQGKYDLKSVLKRSNNAFVTWRYIYERGKEGKHVLLEYEYGRLGVLCEVLRHIIQSRIRNQEVSKRMLRFKKYDELYIYKRRDVSVSCTRYIIETMSPALNSLYLKVKAEADAAGASIVNIDKTNISNVITEHKGYPAILDRKDGSNNIVIGFMPELINEWIYAHELIQYLNPKIQMDLEPALNVSQPENNPEINIELLKEIVRRLFGVIIDHFVNRLVLEAGIDIDIFIDFHANIINQPPENPLQKVYFANNLFATLLMEKFFSGKERHYQKYISVKRAIENKYPGLVPLLTKCVEGINPIDNFEFEKIQAVYQAVLSQGEIINRLYQFAVGIENTELTFSLS